MKLAILLAVLVVCGRCDDGGSTRIQRSALGSSGFSIPKAILSLALDVGRCRSAFSSDCSSNTVYSPLSIASTLTMLLMGNLSEKEKIKNPERKMNKQSQSLQVKWWIHIGRNEW